jgi:Saxitoxin biosynthesis operon protein SxtJ
MLHENLVRNEEIVGPTNRRFGLTLGGVLIFVGFIRALFGHGHAIWWLIAGLVLVVLAAVWPARLGPLNRLWLKFGLLLYKFVNPVVMTLLYSSTIVPIGVVMRLSGKDPLRLKLGPDAETYWIVRDGRGSRPENMRNQF